MPLPSAGYNAAAGVLNGVMLVPVLPRVQDREFARLKEQARHHPAWWNRRLAR